MNISSLVTDLRKEFQERIDDVITKELQQLELEEEQRKILAKELPGLVLPKLTTKEQSQANGLTTKLDKQVDELAELTAKIALISKDYRETLGEINSLLANKEHNVDKKHSQHKLKFMLEELGRIIKADVYNGVLGFRSLPDKEFILSKIEGYRGI